MLNDPNEIDFSVLDASPAQSKTANVMSLYSTVAPKEASAALAIASKAGVPVATAMSDLKTANDMAISRGATSISNASPPMARWAAGDPTKVAATKDDFGNLAEVARHATTDFLEPFKGAWADLQKAAALKGVPSILPAVGAVAEVVGSPISAALNIFTAPGSRVLAANARTTPADIPVLSQLNAAAAKLGFGQNIKTEADRTAFFNENLQSVFQVVAGEGIARVARGRPGTAVATPVAPEAGSGPTATPRAPVAPSDGAVPVNAAGHVLTPEGDAASFATQRDAALYARSAQEQTNQLFETFDDNGTVRVRQRGTFTPAEDVPPPGVDENVDSVRSDIAEVDAGRLKDLETAAAASKTHGRNPDIFNEFLGQQTGDQSVMVSPEKLAEVYAGGDTPFADRFEDIRAAAERGADVEIPLNDYITEVAGKPYADALRDGVRVREDGISPVEAKAEQPPQVTMSMEPGSTASLRIQINLLKAEEETVSKTVTLGGDNEPWSVPGEPKYLAESSRERVQRLVKAQYLSQLFQTPDAAGMLKTQFEKYSSRIEDAIATAVDKMHDRIYTQIARERKPEWQNALAQHRAAAEQDLASRSDLTARSELQYGKTPLGEPVERTKLDRKAVVKSYGQEIVDLLPKGMFGKTNLSPDETAEQFGYSSADALLWDLEKLERNRALAGTKDSNADFKRLVEEEATTRTREELGWAFTPEDIDRAASELLSGPEVTDFLSDELKVLAEQTGAPFDKAAIKARAAELFAQLPVKQALKLKEFERIAGRTGRAAEIALLKNKPGDAFIQKQHQLINTYMLAESHVLNKEFSAAMNRWTRWAGKATLSSTDQEYMNRIHEALVTMGLKVKRDLPELRDQLGSMSFHDWIVEKNRQGAEIALNTVPEEQPVAQKVSDFRGINQTLTHIGEQGREVKTIEVRGQKQELDDFITAFKKRATELGRDYPGSRLLSEHWQDKAERLGRSLVAYNMRFENVFDHFDGDDPFGLLSSAVTEPLQAAKQWENDTLVRLGTDLNKFLKTLPKGWYSSLNNKISEEKTMAFRQFNHEVEDPSEGFTLDNSDRVIITVGNMVRGMLNMGNESNYYKFLKGYGWEKAAWEKFVDENATKEHWAFVKHVWDAHESLWPKVVSEYRKMNGVAPAKIEARIVPTRFGEIEGGYFPARYDPVRQAQIRDFDDNSLFGPENQSAFPSNSFSKSRTGYVGPINLDFTSIMSGLGQTVHDLAFRRALVQGRKILLHKDVQRSFQEVYGKEYKDQLEPWLNYIARERVMNEQGAGWLSNAIRTTRMNATFVGLGYNIKSALKHGFAAAADSTGEVSKRYLAAAVKDMYMSPGQYRYWQEYVDNNSGEMRSREMNVDVNIREQLQRLYEKQGFISNFQYSAYSMIVWADKMSAAPTWLAAQRQHFNETGNLQESFQVGDKAVRKAHGASAPVDIPAILRGGRDPIGEMGRLFTPFLSFLNHAFGRTWRVYKYGQSVNKALDAGDYVTASRDFNKMIGITLAYIVASGTAVSFVEAWSEDKLVPDEHDLTKGLLHTTIGGIPFIGALADEFEEGHSSTLVSQVLHNLKQTGENIWNTMPWGRHDKVSKRWVQESIQTAGYLGRFGTGQIGRSVNYLLGRFNWKRAPRDALQFIHHVMLGSPPKNRKH